MEDPQQAKNNEINNLKKTIGELEKENASLKDNITDLEKKNIVLNERNFKLEQENASLSEKVSDIVEEEKVSKAAEIREIDASELGDDVRRKCPECGVDNPRLIHETVDKTRLISDYPKIYGKKYKCGECGTVWRITI